MGCRVAEPFGKGLEGEEFRGIRKELRKAAKKNVPIKIHMLARSR